MPPFFSFPPQITILKVARTVVELQQWSKVEFHGWQRRVDYKIKELHYLQFQDYFYVDGDKVRRLENETDRLLHFNWLLHNFALACQRRNTIRGLMDEDGQSITFAVGIEQIVLLVFLYDLFIFCP